MLTEIAVIKHIRHTTRVIFTVKICIFERSNEKIHFSKTKIVRTYGATKYKSGGESTFA